MRCPRRVHERDELPRLHLAEIAYHFVANSAGTPHTDSSKLYRHEESERFAPSNGGGTNMRERIRQFVTAWSKETLLALIGVGLLAVAPLSLQAQNCDSDENHYHDGADHCDADREGCYVVCGN
jgi:hypothetical protein